MFSGSFQGLFREFQGVSGCFQGVLPDALSGYALWTLSITSPAKITAHFKRQMDSEGFALYAYFVCAGGVPKNCTEM